MLVVEEAVKLTEIDVRNISLTLPKAFYRGTP